MAEKFEEKTLRDVLKVVFSHFQVFLVGSAAFMIVVLVGAHYIPVKYQSTAVFERRSDSGSDTLGNNPNESFQTMRLTLQQELAGAKAVDKVVEELGLTKNLPRKANGELTPEGQAEKQNLVYAVMTNITVDWKVRADQIDLIAVNCSSNNPKLAEQIPNLLIKHYISYVSEKILERLKASRNFLQKQVTESNRRLAELTSRKIEFEAKFGDLLIDGTTGLTERIQELNSDLEARRLQQSIAKQKVEQVKTLIRTTKVRFLKDHLNQLKNELDVCVSLNEMTEEHPKVKTLKARIAQIERRIRENQKGVLVLEENSKDGIDGGLALQLVSVESELQMVSDDVDRLQKRLTTYKTVMTQSVPLREEYLQITKPLEDQQSLAKRWQGRLTDVEMTIATEEGNRRTQLNKVQASLRPNKPTFPPLWSVVMVAIGGGLAFGYGLSFMVGTMDHTIRKPEEAAELFGVPVVGVTSEIETRRQRAGRRTRQTVINLVILLMVIGTLGFSTYSVMLRLGVPDNSKEWKVAVVTRVSNPQGTGAP